MKWDPMRGYREQEAKANGWRQQYHYAPDGSYDLDHCYVCRGDLPPLLKEFAHQRFEPKTCSSDCRVKAELQRHGCCEKARPLSRACVCMFATECPDHGERHIGTHD